MTLQPKQIIKGYEVVDELGVGGFGAVYRAYQSVLKRDVAIKIVLPNLANDPNFIRRFVLEAEIIARLEHPNIVPIYDYWRDPDGAYIVMRYINGVSLRVRLEQGIPDPHEALHIIEQLSSALHFAHTRQVVHRDLKPENVLLDEDGHVYLVDFGIAKDLSRVHDNDSEGGGTLIYASPEQLTGVDISPQTDIYTFGLLIYEILTGNLPHERTTPHAIKQLQFDEELPDEGKLPPATMDVLRRATHYRPDDRFPNIEALVQSLRQTILGIQTVSAVQVMNIGGGSGELLPLSNPYKGLFAFQEADQDDFYGREPVVNSFLSKMQSTGIQSRLLAVVGPSGSGKSSVVKAGLVPQLRAGAIDGSDNWYIADMYPGDHPFDELEVALLRVATKNISSLGEQLQRDERGLTRALNIILPSKDSQLLLIIDQFEELFTMVDDEEQRTRFLQMLVSAIRDPHSQLRVVLTLRADFYHGPLHYHDFGELLRQCTEVILPMENSELELAIRQPAEKLGVQFEPGLVDILIHDVNHQPGLLPLLQFALVQLFENRSGQVITRAAYTEMGGVVGALAGTADEIYNNLSIDEQRGVRELMLRLVTPGEEADDTRRRVRLNELSVIPEIDAILDILGFARLVTFDYEQESRLPTVEIAHEALIRTWTRYQAWIDETRDELRLQRSLTLATHEWINHDRDPGFLAESARLTQFELWSEQSDLSLSSDESDYLRQSLDARDQRQRIENERKEHELILQRQAASRLRIILSLVTVSLIVVAILGFMSFQSATIAQEQAATATVALGVSERNEQRALVAESTAVQQSYESSSLLLSSRLNDIARNNPFLAYGLGLAMLDMDREMSSGVRAAVNDHVLNSRAIAELGQHDDWVNAVDISANGTIAVSGSQDKTVRVWDMETRSLQSRLVGHSGWVTSVAISPDGRYILSGDSHYNIIYWDVASEQIVFELAGHTGTINGLAFAPDGMTALSASNDTTLKLWDLENGVLLNTFQWHEERVTDVVFSPNGRNALSSSDDESVILWEVQMGLPNRIFVGHESEVASVAISPDGRYAISGGHDNRILEWDIANIENLDPIHQYEGHSLPLRKVVYSPDGNTILSTSWDETLILWDRQTGKAIDTLQGHQDWVNDVAFSPDGQIALSGSRDKTLLIWDVGKREYSLNIDAHNDATQFVVLSPDERWLLSAGADYRIVLWDADTGEQIRTFEGHRRKVTYIKFLDDGQTFLSGSYDETVILWDIQTGKQINVFGAFVDDDEIIPNGVNWISVSPDEQTFLSAMEANVIWWDIDTGEKLLVIDGPEILSDGHFHAVEFLPDGETALVALGSDLQLRNLSNGDVLRAFSGHTDWINGLATTDDFLSAVTSSSDQSLIHWDIQTGNALQTYESHTNIARSVAIAPDNLTMTSTADDGRVIVWDMLSGEPIRIIDGSSGAILSVVYTADGQSLITGGADGSIKLWNLWLTDDELKQWAYANRTIIEPTCDDFYLYRSPNRFECSTTAEA